MKKPNAPSIEILEVSDGQIAEYYNKMSKNKMKPSTDSLKRRGRPKKEFGLKDLPKEEKNNNEPLPFPENKKEGQGDFYRNVVDLEARISMAALFRKLEITDDLQAQFIDDINYYFQASNGYEIELIFGAIFYQKYFSNTKSKNLQKGV